MDLCLAAKCYTINYILYPWHQKDNIKVKFIYAALSIFPLIFLLIERSYDIKMLTENVHWKVDLRFLEVHCFYVQNIEVGRRSRSLNRIVQFSNSNIHANVNTCVCFLINLLLPLKDESGSSRFYKSNGRIFKIQWLNQFRFYLLITANYICVYLWIHVLFGGVSLTVFNLTNVLFQYRDIV